MAQLHERAAEMVLARADEWAAAERANDAAALDRLLAPGFVGVGPFGFMLSKTEWLARYRSGDLKNSALTLNEASVRLFGDAAILIGRQSSTAAYQGHETGGQFRASLVFVREGDAWLLAGLQYSAIGAPPNLGPRP